MPKTENVISDGKTVVMEQKIYDRLVGALKSCMSDLAWAEEEDKNTNFQSSLIKGDGILNDIGEKA